MIKWEHALNEKLTNLIMHFKFLVKDPIYSQKSGLLFTATQQLQVIKNLMPVNIASLRHIVCPYMDPNY